MFRGTNPIDPGSLLQVLLVVSNPEVYKSPASDCYIVFGEAKVRFSLLTLLEGSKTHTLFDVAPAQLEDNSSAAQIAAAQQVAASQQAAQGALAQGGFSDNQGPQSLEDLLKEADEGEGDKAAASNTDGEKKADESAAAPVKIDEADVKLVMEQANCDKDKATKALQDAKGDLIVASEFGERAAVGGAA